VGALFHHPLSHPDKGFCFPSPLSLPSRRLTRLFSPPPPGGRLLPSSPLSLRKGEGQGVRDTQLITNNLEMKSMF